MPSHAAAREVVRSIWLSAGDREHLITAITAAHAPLVEKGKRLAEHLADVRLAWGEEYEEFCAALRDVVGGEAGK